MATHLQLELFDPVDELSLLQKDFRLLDRKCQNVQRGLFARFGTLEETVETLRDLCYQQKIEIETLKERVK